VGLGFLIPDRTLMPPDSSMYEIKYFIVLFFIHLL